MLQRLHLSCAVLIALCATPLFAVEEWPQFRGPDGQGVSTATGVPVEWSATKNVVWKIELPGKGWSSPVVSGDKIYLTAAEGPQDHTVLHVFCIDAKNGKGIWDTPLFQPDQAIVKQMHSKNSPASATPIVAGDRLYVHFGTMGTAALDLSGKIIWRQTGLHFPPVHGNGGSPALINGLLVFTCDGGKDPFIAALDAGTGAIKWKTPRNSAAKRPFSFCTPLAIEVNGAKQLVIPGSSLVGGYDPADGHEIWRVRYGDGYSVVPRPVYSHGLLLLSSGFDAPTFYAIKPDGAKGDVTASNVAWTTKKGAPLTPSAVVVGDEAYLVSDAGIATCVDVTTGNQIWLQRLNGHYSASPVAAEGRIYFQSEEGVGTVIKAGKTFQQLASNDLSERSLASYAVVDHAIFIRTESHLWKIGPAPLN